MSFSQIKRMDFIIICKEEWKYPTTWSSSSATATHTTSIAHLSWLTPKNPPCFYLTFWPRGPLELDMLLVAQLQQINPIKYCVVLSLQRSRNIQAEKLP